MTTIGTSDGDLTRRSVVMGVGLALAGALPARADAPIERELALITPVSRFIHHAALEAFAEFARRQWGVALRTSAITADAPVAYGRIVEWKGRPDVDVVWGGESALFGTLVDRNLLQKVEIPRETWDQIPEAIGKPVPIPLKDETGYWVGTALEPYGLVYNPGRLERLGVPALRDWNGLLDPRLKGEVAQCAPTRSPASNATYEVILSMYGEDRGWEWMRRLAANTGIFTTRTRDVPAVVARGEFAAGFAVPSSMAFEEKLAGLDIRFVAPGNACVRQVPMAVLAGARHPRAARAFAGFLLSERGQRVLMERGLFPITPRDRVQGGPGSTAEMAAEFAGGLRSFFDADLSSVYDEAAAIQRSEVLNTRFRSEIEARWGELRR